MQDWLCSSAGGTAFTLAQASQMMLGKARVLGTQVSKSSGCRVCQGGTQGFQVSHHRSGSLLCSDTQSSIDDAAQLCSRHKPAI